MGKVIPGKVAPNVLIDAMLMKKISGKAECYHFLRSWTREETVYDQR